MVVAICVYQGRRVSQTLEEEAVPVTIVLINP